MSEPFVQGFHFIDVDGFLSFAAELDQHPWREIDARPWMPRSPAPSSLLAASPLVLYKLRLLHGVSLLMEVVQQLANTNLKVLDGRWDSLQRRLHYRTGDALESQNPSDQEAARRLRASLLKGDGTAQTNLTFKREVDWGRRQVLLSRQVPLSQDIERLGLSELIADIEQATEALALALEQSEGPDADESRARQDLLLGAKTSCQQSFASVFEWLQWHAEQAELSPSERELLDGLLRPLRDLLARAARPPEPPFRAVLVSRGGS
jgi:hypothetical protein